MKIIPTIVFLILLPKLTLAQDDNFTQKTGNINHFNPALVGAQSNFGVQLNYNNQSHSLLNNFQTYSLLTNYNLSNGIGFGLELFSDRRSISQKSHIKANLNYQHMLSNIEIRYGMTLGIGQTIMNFDRLRFENQIDPSLGFTNTTAEPIESDPINYAVIDLGAASFYKGFLVGIGVQQANEPNISSLTNQNAKLKRRIVANVGYLKELENISFAGLATYQQSGVFSMLETQVYSQYKFVKLGFGYGQSFGTFYSTDFFSSSIGVQFDKFSVGYSYEDDLSNSARASLGATHQATAAWYIWGLSNKTGMSKFMNVMM